MCFPDIDDAIVQQAMASVQEAIISKEDAAAFVFGPDDLIKTIALALLEPLGRLLHVFQRWKDEALVVPLDRLRYDVRQVEQALWEMQQLVSAPFPWLSEYEVEVAVFIDMYREIRMHVTMILCYVRLLRRTMDVRPSAYIERYLQLAMDKGLVLASYLIKVVKTAPKLDWIIPPYFIR
jgi:hypothetical protein